MAYQCEVFGAEFPRLSLLPQNSRLQNYGKKYICPSCKNVFNTKDDFDRHQKKHADENSRICPECLKVFSWEDALDANLHLDHGLEATKRNAEEYGAEVFTGEVALNAHLHQAHGWEATKRTVENQHSESTSKKQKLQDESTPSELHTWDKVSNRKVESTAAPYYEISISNSATGKSDVVLNRPHQGHGGIDSVTYQCERNIKFFCLNVNGLKNRIKNPKFAVFLSKFDILCLTETNLDDTDIVNIDDYSHFSKNRSRAYKRKSGGIAVYVKDTLSPFIELLPSQSEYALWISIDKAATSLDENLILGTLYVPPKTSRFYSQHLFTDLENEISTKCGEFKYVCLAGDINCHVGTRRDFILPESHLNERFDVNDETRTNLYKYQVLQSLPFNLHRNSKDKRTDANGLKWLDICKNNNLFLLNGRSFLDKDVGQYTFRDKSVLDFVMVTADCFRNLQNFEIIETDRLFSDGHNALSWQVKVTTQSSSDNVSHEVNTGIIS